MILGHRDRNLITFHYKLESQLYMSQTYGVRTLLIGYRGGIPLGIVFEGKSLIQKAI